LFEWEKNHSFADLREFSQSQDPSLFLACRGSDYSRCRVQTSCVVGTWLECRELCCQCCLKRRFIFQRLFLVVCFNLSTWRGETSSLF
jgi:hypothetical protein